MHQYPEFIQGNSTMKITWILGVLDLNLILQFYKKAHIGAWLFKQRVNSTQKITWIWEIFALWPTISSFLLFFISTFLLCYPSTFLLLYFSSLILKVKSTEKITWIWKIFPAIAKPDSTILQEITPAYLDIKFILQRKSLGSLDF